MKKKYLSLLLISVLMLSFVGVGYTPAMTKDSLLKKMDAAQSSIKSYSADVNLDFESTISQAEDAKADSSLIDGSLTGTLPFNMTSNLKVSSIVKTGISKTEGTVSINLFGSEMSEPILSYAQEGKKYTTTYTYDSELKTWSKEKSTTNSDLMDSFNDLNTNDDWNNFTLADSLVSCNNKDCYQLTGVIDSNELQGTMNETDFDSMGVSPSKVSTTIYIDSTTFYPVKYVFDISNNDFSQTNDSNTDDYNLKVSKFDFTIDIQYNTVKSLKIPKKALKAKKLKAVLVD